MTTVLARAARHAALGIGAAICAAWASPSAAQSMPSVPSGALTGEPSAGGKLFKLDVTGKIVYDSNVSGGQADVADAKGLHQDDFIYSPSANLDFSLPVGRGFIFLNGSGGYDFHQYNTILDHLRTALTAGAGGTLGRCSGEITDLFSSFQTDQTNLPVQVTKNTQTTQNIGVQLTCSTGTGLGEFLTVRHFSTDNSAQIGVVDSSGLSASAGLSYQNPVLGALSVFGAYSTSDYSVSDPTISAPPGYESYSVGVSYARPIGTRLKGAVQFSLQSTRPDGSGGPPTVGLPVVTGSGGSYTGFSFAGSLNYQVNPRLEADLQFQRGVEPTIQIGSNFTVIESVVATLHYRLSSRLSASGGVTYREINYHADGTVLSTLPAAISEDSMTSVFGALSLNVGRRATLKLDARYQSRNTNLTIFDYNEYRLGVTATQSF